ncbi:MAG: hemerythrin domain-containing protein [Betaproteobacteria bacterium]|nr:hemerythrin domain-containing protein [Betaproteobacteria bacterium]
MRTAAIQIIKDEHSAISSVLYALRYLVRQMREAAMAPNFPLLRAILDYIVSYPNRWHHPKEDDYLFLAVKRRTKEANALIAALEKEHQVGYPLIENLKQLLLDFQNDRPGAREDFFNLVDRYTELEWQHMRREEDDLFPIAERVLTADDWKEIYAAFRENDNPLFGIKPKEEAERLYRRILTLAPAPIGYASMP